MCVVTKSRPELKMGHVGSKTSSSGQLLNRPYVLSRRHSFDSVFMKRCQNDFLTLNKHLSRRAMLSNDSSCYPFFFLFLYYMLIIKICVGVFSGIFKARMLKLGIHMDNELLYCSIENGTPCSYSSLYLSIFYPVFFVFVFRLLRICVTVFFANYLLLLIYSSALLKQCSGAIVRFSDSSSLSNFLSFHTLNDEILRQRFL